MSGLFATNLFIHINLPNQCFTVGPLHDQQGQVIACFKLTVICPKQCYLRYSAFHAHLG